MVAAVVAKQLLSGPGRDPAVHVSLAELLYHNMKDALNQKKKPPTYRPKEAMLFPERAPYENEILLEIPA